MAASVRFGRWLLVLALWSLGGPCAVQAQSSRTDARRVSPALQVPQEPEALRPPPRDSSSDAQSRQKIDELERALRNERARYEDSIRRKDQEIGRKNEELASTNRELADTRRQLGEAMRKLRELEAAKAVADDELATTRSQLDDARQRSQAAETAKAALEGELATIRGQRDKAGQEGRRLASANDTLEGQLATTRSQRDQARQENQQLEAAKTALERELAAGRREIQRLSQARSTSVWWGLLVAAGALAAGGALTRLVWPKKLVQPFSVSVGQGPWVVDAKMPQTLALPSFGVHAVLVPVGSSIRPAQGFVVQRA